MVVARSTKLRMLLPLLGFRLLVALLVAGWSPYSILSAHPGRPFGELVQLTFAGAVVIGAGAAGYAWCIWDFAFIGRSFGPSALVARGIYRRVRHPMYLSLMLVLLGESLLFKSWRLLGDASVFAAGVHLFVVLYEEPRMVKRWGAAYLEYCRRVPRWIPQVVRTTDGR